MFSAAAATFDLHLIAICCGDMNHHLSPAGAAARHTVSDSVSVTRPTRDRGRADRSPDDGEPPHARTADDTR